MTVSEREILHVWPLTQLSCLHFANIHAFAALHAQEWPVVWKHTFYNTFYNTVDFRLKAYGAELCQWPDLRREALYLHKCILVPWYPIVTLCSSDRLSWVCERSSWRNCGRVGRRDRPGWRHRCHLQENRRDNIRIWWLSDDPHSSPICDECQTH